MISFANFRLGFLCPFSDALVLVDPARGVLLLSSVSVLEGGVLRPATGGVVCSPYSFVQLPFESE